MSFLDNVKRQEQEKHRTSAWSQSVVNYLSRYLRQYLRKAEAKSALRVKADLFRVDKILLDRLTVLLHEETVTITPLSFSDSRAPARGGCILVQSTNGVVYHLLWDGISPVVQDHWVIARADNRRQRDNIEPDHRTVSYADPGRELQPLSEKSLDEAFETLFGLADRVESNRHQPQHPVKLIHPAERIHDFTKVVRICRV
jgi:hypothetical protein